MRNYYEIGCLCFLTGRLNTLPPLASDEEVYEHFEFHCRCSRSGEHRNHDKELEAIMRKEWHDNSPI